MKKLFVLLFVLGFFGFSQAQWILDSFDNSVRPNTNIGTNWADTAKSGTNFYAGSPASAMDLANSADSYDGTGSMKISYNIAISGGGWIVRTNYHEATIADLPWKELSAGTELSLWYKVAVPADIATAGAIVLEFKLAEFDDAGARDVFYYQPVTLDFFDASGQWKNIRMPLVKTPDNTTGFALQFGDNDGELQLDKIKGFEIAIASNGSTQPAQGAILIDKLELVGNRYKPFQTFDNAATDVFNVDFMGWAGAGAGAATLTNNTTDFVEGTGSMQLDYTINASQDWGGYVNMTDTTWVLPDSFTNRTALVLYVKNVNPLTGTTPKRVTFRFFLMENSTGVNEDWVIEVPINFEQAGEWTRYYLPLQQDTAYTDSDNKVRFPQGGFAQTWWQITGDNLFNQAFITGYKIEFSAGGNEYGPKDEKFTGTVLFDVLQQSGFKFDDKEAPAAPVITLIPSAGSNLVTWLDISGELKETYSVYASVNPITDVEADGVELIKSGIARGVQVWEHKMISANVPKPRTYYYAVTCKDLAGNVSVPGTAGPITNNAKGVTTVSINPPTPFVADGNFSEWAGITPFVMSTGTESAFVPLTYTVDGDNDLSAEVKVAIDNNYLYVMMDVTDDVYNHPLDINPWERDEPDLYIGLYNLTETHIVYGTGTTADYQIRFDEDRIRLDGDANNDCDSLVFIGENYFHDAGTMKFPSGYLFEARIPLVDLATKRNSGKTSIDVINWKVGDRIPFTVGINDNDGAGRVGIIFYYPQATEEAYRNVSSWGYTWISDEVTGVDDNPNLVNAFDLKQNYPNPFNPSTKIQYSIAEPGLVSIRVFDILGRQIADLVNKQQSAGSYTVDFDAKNLSAGVYFYKIEAGSFTASKKMILMK